MHARSDYEQSLLDQQSEAGNVAHAENLKASIESGWCPNCRARHVVEINPKNIKFMCGRGSGFGHSAPCGWLAIYPIATIGNSSPLHAENAALKAEIERLKDEMCFYNRKKR